MRSPVLVLDEPTTGIDAALRVDVFGALRELLAGRETAVLYISHDLAEIASIADDLGVMYAGQLVEYGPRKRYSIVHYTRTPWRSERRCRI